MTAVISRPPETPKLTLVYAKMQALAEPARMLMSYANIPFEDVYPWDYYGKAWREGGKHEAPFGQVPVLVVDDEVSIDQSGAIQRYLSRITGTCPADPLLAAQADALCDNAGELFAISNPVANFFKGDLFETKVAAFTKSFAVRLNYFDWCSTKPPRERWFPAVAGIARGTLLPKARPSRRSSRNRQTPTRRKPQWRLLRLIRGRLSKRSAPKRRRARRNGPKRRCASGNPQWRQPLRVRQ